MCLVYNQSQSDRLESFQRKVTKFIFYKSGKHDLSYEDRLKILKLETLEKRRKILIMKLLFKIKSKNLSIPPKWFNELTFKENPRTRCRADIKMNRLIKSDKYIFDYSAKMFNSLPINIRNECNFNIFVNNLNYLL